VPTTFTVSGPFTVPTLRDGGGKRVDKKQLSGMWETVAAETSPDGQGCYIFAMRAGKGALPVYVGKATRSFRQECFSTDKLLKLTNAMTSYRSGTPILFLIRQERHKGKPNLKAIRALEEFLVQNALARNPDKLQNVHFTKRLSWSITGVFRTVPGKPTLAARTVRKVLGLAGKTTLQGSDH
jgi:hypothetical protein